MTDDASVIRRVLAGDIQAFRILVERYQGPLFALLRNLVPDRQECEDIAQNAFLSAYVNLRAYDPARASFRTWLYAIARNLCVNAWKKRRPRPATRLPDICDPRTPEATLETQELFQQLDACLCALPAEQKTVFVLAELQELSHEEIAQIEGVKPGTVKSRLSRAKEKLRSLLLRTVERP